MYLTILLSPALLVGFYGMNVMGLPVAEKSYGVWFAFGLMVIGILISYLIIRFIKPRAV
jgi:Mg2+ and Co2+ transporter CorA